VADRGTSGAAVERAGREDIADAAVPTKPPPFDRQGFLADDLIDFTPEIKEQALKVAERYTFRSALYAPDCLRFRTGATAY